MINKTPIADQESYVNECHGNKIYDNYFWLRDKNWPKLSDNKIINYLSEENKYYDEFFNPLSKHIDNIVNELKDRVELTDQSPYTQIDDFYYYTRIEESKEHCIYCRKHISMDNVEEIILDVNDIVLDNKFIRIGTFSVSPDHKLLAYSLDLLGDERYTIKLYDIDSKKHFEYEIPNSIGEIVWHRTYKGFFYLLLDSEWRHNKIMFHYLDNINEDHLVFYESDNLYSVEIFESNSIEYMFVNVHGHNNNYYYYISIYDLNLTPLLIYDKQDDVFYDVEHNGNFFYIKTNNEAYNFKIIKVNVEDILGSSFCFVSEDENKYLIDFDITKDYLILNYLNNGIPEIFIKELTTNKINQINFIDSVFNAYGFCANFLTNEIRISYSSLLTPKVIYKYDFVDDRLFVIKSTKIPKDFKSNEYELKRIYTDDYDVRVPITIFYKKSLFNNNGSNPLYLYGYGAYGISVLPSFSNFAIALANRGFIYAISHVRGGNELGYFWYQNGKLLNKKNTFNDFIASIKTLIKDKYTNSGNIVISGGSAGGLLIGAVINQFPTFFNSAIMHVPFLDVLNTMLDESLPLTPCEFNEWGNPQSKDFFDYIKSYSPYDNIKKQKYPNIMITSGIADSRVGYWEAAKFVAKLRNYKTDKNLLLLKINFNSGHSGETGKSNYFNEMAQNLVYIFYTFNMIH